MKPHPIINQLLAKAPDWMVSRGDSNDIVLGTMGRLVRNLKDFPFPGWSQAEDRQKVSNIILPFIKKMMGTRSLTVMEMSELSYTSRLLLQSHKLLTPCMAARQDGCHVIVHNKQNTVFFVNEEEHLVVHVTKRGNNINGVFEELTKLHISTLEQLPLAADAQHGFLTSLPAEAGEGIQYYSFLHLPALNHTGMMGAINNAMEKLHVNLSPFYSDGEDDTGNLFILSSLPGPITDSFEVVDHYRDVLATLTQREREVRTCLLRGSTTALEDAISRAYGLLRYARLLNIKEVHNAISSLRFGTQMQLLCWEGMTVGAAIACLKKLDLKLTEINALNHADDPENLSRFFANTIQEFLNHTPHHFSFTQEN